MGWTDGLSFLPFYTKCKGAYFIFAFILGLIFAYALFLRLFYGNERRMQHDFLNRVFITIPGIGPCSYWGLTHFLLFLVLGILFPDCDVLIITAGILWEIFEVFMSLVTRKPHQTVVMGITDKTIEYNYTWWGGSFKDILLNIAGFYVGKGYRRFWERWAGDVPFNCCQTGPQTETEIRVY